MRRIVGALTMSVCAVFAAALLHAPSAAAATNQSQCRVTEDVRVCITVERDKYGLYAYTTAEALPTTGVEFERAGTHVRVTRDTKPEAKQVPEIQGSEQNPRSGNVRVQAGDQIQGRASFTLTDRTRVTAATSGILDVREPLNPGVFG
ncbi:hypothetical protein [Nocardiopsis nanhaiensis]